MKRYLKSFVITEEFIQGCVFDCLKRKWNRRDVRLYLSEYSNETINSSNCKKVIEQISHDLYMEIIERRIKLKKIYYQKRVDKSNHKVREIGIASIKQQLYDYIVVDACKQMFMAKIGANQCASIKGRGQIYGKNKIAKWLKHDRKGTKYAYKCDIKSFYPSVPHDKIKEVFERDIKNKDIVYIANILIDSYKQGLSIGSYFSQFMANYYISYAYHYLYEKCYKMHNGKRINCISHTLFYMDDIIIFSSNKRSLRFSVDNFRRYLKEMGLEIKENERLFKVNDDTCIDMMGFKIRKTHVTIRKRIWKRIFKLLLIYKDKRKHMTERVAKKFIAYNGWIMNSSHRKIEQRFKICELMNIAKERVKNHDIKNCIESAC